MVYFWLIMFVVFLIIEGVTAGLASIWFAVGALAALISTLFGAPIGLQILWFLLVSAIVLYFIRPLAKKYVNPIRKPTNADRVLEIPSLVIEDINNLEERGTVLVDGKHWTARSATGDVIKKDALVRAIAIEGVKLIVVPMQEGAPHTDREPAQSEAGVKHDED
jgi:membrane protein implicated in regulation of membrane protease activity